MQTDRKKFIRLMGIVLGYVVINVLLVFPGEFIGYGWQAAEDGIPLDSLATIFFGMGFLLTTITLLFFRHHRTFEESVFLGLGMLVTALVMNWEGMTVRSHITRVSVVLVLLTLVCVWVGVQRRNRN